MSNKSPFPGMDPYIESRHWWKGVHTQLIGELSTHSLPPLLAPAYYVDAERSLQVLAEKDLFPDVEVVQAAPLPLIAPDEHVPIPLQEAFEAVYQARSFRARLDYTHDPEGPLTEEQRAYLRARLKTSGVTSE